MLSHPFKPFLMSKKKKAPMGLSFFLVPARRAYESYAFFSLYSFGVRPTCFLNTLEK